LNDIGRNSLQGNSKKTAKFLMRTFTCRSTFLYGFMEAVFGSGINDSGSGSLDGKPILILNHGFDDQKLEKNLQAKKNLIPDPLT
jgi:hypothetical protein